MKTLGDIENALPEGFTIKVSRMGGWLPTWFASAHRGPAEVALASSDKPSEAIASVMKTVEECF